MIRCPANAARQVPKVGSSRVRRQRLRSAACSGAHNPTGGWRRSGRGVVCQPGDLGQVLFDLSHQAVKRVEVFRFGQSLQVSGEPLDRDGDWRDLSEIRRVRRSPATTPAHDAVRLTRVR